jgi:LysM repeat protein
MKKTVSSVAMVLALAGLQSAAAAAEEFVLYAPTPQQGEPAIPHQGDGVLVKRLTIRKGDTLTRIARKNIGKGSYYPQILLFNDIPNPNLIYAGKQMLVPVVKSSQLTEAPKPESETVPMKQAEPVKKAVPAAPVQPVRAAKPGQQKVTAAPKVSSPAAPATKSGQTAEQLLYAKGISEYNKGHYPQALTIFSHFMEKYPASPLMPDATLYKAESLLNLSEK